MFFLYSKDSATSLRGQTCAAGHFIHEQDGFPDGDRDVFVYPGYQSALQQKFNKKVAMHTPDYRLRTPDAQGLYHPQNEHDACGMGLVASIRGERSHGDTTIVRVNRRAVYTRVERSEHRSLPRVVSESGIVSPRKPGTASTLQKRFCELITIFQCLK